jgi:hypothetical protein
VALMPAHYLQPLQKTVLPARHVIFDTETQLTRQAGALEHRYRTGAAGEGGAGLWDTCIYPQDTPKQLWERIAATCRKGHRTVAWAHNISFDLRVSEALRWLPRQGFKLQGIVLERTASWASWTSKTHGSLICCDLYAWLPRSLDDIAREMGVSRETWDSERYQNATLPELQARCIADVQVTRQAVQALLTWLQEEDAGPFRLTGSGQAHACWRKRFNAGKRLYPPGEATRGIENIEQAHRENHGVWVHGDPELRQLEREAMWTGRCEAWRHGPQTGPLYEYDMNLAYCRIASGHELPVHLRGEHGPLTPEQIQVMRAQGMAVLAEVSVEGLQEPVVPCRAGERMIWPVGDFETTLWDPELALLPPGMFHVKRCWSYQTGSALKPMAEWIIQGLESTSTPPPIRLLLKHWARALIGRMALRYRRWEDYGTMPDLGLALWVGYDEDGLPTENLQVGHDRFQLAELTETETSAPQITGWVMSQCRAQLWQCIQVAGPKNVLYMDTDSLLVDGGGHRRIQESFYMLDSLEKKATWSHAEIYGPRNLELDQERRLSGVPRTATRKGPLEYEGTVMRGIKESIIRSELDHVAQLDRPYHVSSVDPRRERYPDGTTRPYRLGGDTDGTT